MPRQSIRARGGGAQAGRLRAQPKLATRPRPGPRILTGHVGKVHSVAILPDGSRALSGGEDKTARLWDLETGAELRRFKDEAGSEVHSIAVLPDGRRALFGCDTGIILLWDVEAWIELRRLDGHWTDVWSVAVLPDGRRGLSGGADCTMRLWDLDTGAELYRFGHSASIQSVAALPDGKRVLSGGVDHAMRLWDLDTGAELRRFEEHTTGVMSVAALPDGRRALSGSAGGTMRLWDLETGAVLRTFGTPVRSIGVLPDGRRALVGSGFETAVQLWDLDTGAKLRRFEGHTGESIASRRCPTGGALSPAPGTGPCACGMSSRSAKMPTPSATPPRGLRCWATAALEKPGSAGGSRMPRSASSRRRTASNSGSSTNWGEPAKTVRNARRCCGILRVNRITA